MKPKAQFVSKEIRHIPKSKVSKLQKLFKIEGATKIQVEPDGDDDYKITALFDPQVLTAKEFASHR